MKKNIILLITFLFTITIFAQSNFTNGFNKGYKKGFCQDQGIGCIEPIPPIAPIPKIGESSDSYTDGYNRGFQMGLKARKNNNSPNNSAGRQGYKTSTSKFEPLSYNELLSIPMALQKRYNQNQEYLYALKKWILELKPQIKEQKFINRLNGEYSVLTSMEEDDLARATTALKQSENSIREVISEYNTFLSKQKNNIQTYNKTTKSNNNPNEETNYAQKGFELQKEEKYADAIYNYSKFLETNENNTDVLFLRAMCKSELKDRYGAIDDYDRIIELEKIAKPQVYKISTVYNNKAYCLVGLKKYEQALPYVTKALEMDKSEAYIWDTRGELYYHVGEYEKSIKDMDRALKIQKNANSYYFRALSYLKLDKKSKACSDLSKAGELGETKAYEKISENCN